MNVCKYNTKWFIIKTIHFKCGYRASILSISCFRFFVWKKTFFKNRGKWAKNVFLFFFVIALVLSQEFQLWMFFMTFVFICVSVFSNLHKLKILCFKLYWISSVKDSGSKWIPSFGHYVSNIQYNVKYIDTTAVCYLAIYSL